MGRSFGIIGTSKVIGQLLLGGTLPLVVVPCRFLEPLFCCLMDNHVHLLIETLNVDISKIMYFLNKDYAVYFNQKYSFVGHLFQGRFRWELVDSDPYYLEVSRYIHLNPVNAEMVERPIQYSWSSYASYVQDDIENVLVDTGKILGYFTEPKRVRYQKFVEEGIIRDVVSLLE
ncbi:MAG: transposase [Desulfitobacteriaceae bacterium]